ncbi:xanthine dehydrogenase accessory factor [Brevibacterium pityocampae]
MRDICEPLLAWLEEGRECAVAVVVDTWSSAPRPAGTMMAVDRAGEAIGSLSGGCIEGAVHALALEVMESRSAQIAHYGISDDEAFGVGLACGGTLDVCVVPVTDPAALIAFLHAVRAESPAALALRLPADPAGSAPGDALGGGSPWLAVPVEDATVGGLGHPRLDAHVAEDARGLLTAGSTRVREYDSTGRRLGGGTRVLIVVSAAPPRLLVYGAIDYARALAGLGRFLGYRVTVCDARPVFATAARFPEAHEVVARWPHDHLAAEISAGRVDPSTVVAVLTHDLKFDVPVLAAALRADVGYVGALGSRRTHALRLAGLREAGLSEEELGRLRAPIGLDLGARTPEATAVSIFAEVLRDASGATGLPLTSGAGPIHR